MQYINVVILAKTRQRDGYNIAGRELYLERQRECLGGWIHLVSEDRFSHGALLNKHFQVAQDDDVAVLDVVLVPVKALADEPGQPNNVLINECVRLIPKGRIPAAIISVFVENPQSLWWLPNIPSHIVPADQECPALIPQSLYIIKATQLCFTLSHQFNPYTGRYQRKLKAAFEYQGHCYHRFSVLDPKVRCMLGRQYPGPGAADREITLLKGDNYYLCVSLGARFGRQKHHYKSIMTIFDIDGYLQRNYAR